MPYIPKKHIKYSLLPYCKEHGGEVFSYPFMQHEIDDLLPDGESVIPYGYNSYNDFYRHLDNYINLYGTEDNKINKLGEMLVEYKKLIAEMNVKENWSVLKYIGNSTDESLGLTHGRCYYWPCSVENPVYEGVIDDEEFTSYDLYSASPEDWEIIDDPLGMAYRTLYGDEYK